MNLPQAGGCQCGALRYEITKAPQLVYTCHCTESQRLTGSAFTMAMVIGAAAFRLAGKLLGPTARNLLWPRRPVCNLLARRHAIP
jgi:hypothetical protein